MADTIHLSVNFVERTSHTITNGRQQDLPRRLPKRYAKQSLFRLIQWMVSSEGKSVPAHFSIISQRSI